MSTLEDKLLNGPTITYCSSSEDEDVEVICNNDDTNCGISASNYGLSKNTGPKGVKQDYYEHLQLKKEEEKIKRDLLVVEAKKFNLTSSQNNEESDSEDELERLRNKRLNQLKQKKFNSLKTLEHSGEYLTAIENSRNCLTFIHIYKKNCDNCEDVDSALASLSIQYPNHKYFRIESYLLPTSDKFRQNACPALQVYYNESLVGNFIRFDNYFNDDIIPEKVVLFLKQHDILLTSSIEADEEY
ncbi:Phosducin-like protein [Strongyloides ratti]|uniref:Phosducin-like protein n=1 Tax=Strongyloides ratti TaxID=34506 RepID=A0A090L9K5_STRRB|nr:Phosducin-like protein [Strongyloides ratti]CEF66471.1 Phosducin-like protein [Strongyloides ratti]